MSTPQSPNRSSASPSDAEERPVRDEPLFATDPSKERHAHDSSSVAPSRAEQPRRALRSITFWAFFLLTIVALSGVVFMALHPHPVDSGRVRGPGDEAAPNAPPDFKRR